MKGGVWMWVEEVWEHRKGDVTSQPFSPHPSLFTNTHICTHTHTSGISRAFEKHICGHIFDGNDLMRLKVMQTLCVYTIFDHR